VLDFTFVLDNGCADQVLSGHWWSGFRWDGIQTKTVFVVRLFLCSSLTPLVHCFPGESSPADSTLGERELEKPACPP